MMHLRYFCVFWAVFGLALNLSAKDKVVGILQIVGHPSLNAVEASVVKTLKERYPQGLKILSENAHGSLSTSLQIAQKYAGLPVDLMVAIATPSAQSALSVSKKHGIPLVFAAVSDPVAAKLVSTVDAPDGLVTGVMDAQPIRRQLDLIRRLLPKAKTIGVIYNPGEVNSVQTLAKLKAEGKDFTFIEGPATHTQTVATAAQHLLPKVDVIYLPADNTAVSALETLLRLAFSHKKPVISADPNLVLQGALASHGITYEAIGEATAQKVLAVLEGKPVASLPIETPQITKTWVNLSSAKRLGLTLKLEDLEGAEYVHSP